MSFPPTTKKLFISLSIAPSSFSLQCIASQNVFEFMHLLLIDSSYTKSLLLKNLRDFYLKYKSLRTSRRSCHHPQQHCCPGIAHSPFLSWVLLLLRLSDQAQIWLPLAMINDFSYPQRLRS